MAHIHQPHVPAAPFFDEHRSAEVVNARMGTKIDPRLREVMTIVVNHLHEAVREAQITPEEWEVAIRFLTDVGHMCTDWRQEFILLSDVLGVTMLVDAINHHRPAGATENTVLGPFYIEETPHYEHGANLCLDGKGEPLVVRGKVFDHLGEAVKGAKIEIWSTNNDGFYDIQQKDLQPEHNLRGILTSGEDGGYWFRTAKPRYYPIPDDGPVGQLLKSIGRHPNRAAHLHFKVTAKGYDPLVTHIFTPDCIYLTEDAVFGVKQSLVADFREIYNDEEAKHLDFTNPFWAVDWDFVLAPAR